MSILTGKKVVFETVEVTGEYPNRTIVKHSHEGIFLDWGIAFEELESGVGTYTCAIIEEAETRRIHQVIPEKMKFIATIWEV